MEPFKLRHWIAMVMLMPIAAISGVAIALGLWWLVMVQLVGAILN